MTTYTPQQAREMMGRALDHGTMAGVVESLAAQVEVLTAERDAALKLVADQQHEMDNLADALTDATDALRTAS